MKELKRELKELMVAYYDVNQHRLITEEASAKFDELCDDLEELIGARKVNTFVRTLMK